MAMPGDVRKYVGYERCQANGCNAYATKEVVGETDSFGSEYHYYCDRHYKPVSRYRRGTCERCGADVEVRLRRDPEEGNNGPLYEMCDPCYHKLIRNFD